VVGEKFQATGGLGILPFKKRRVGWGRTVTAVRQAPSRKAREVAHPQLFRPMLKDKPGLYLPVNVAHPPLYERGAAGVAGTGRTS